MSFCEFCGYDVLGPCDNARLAERCQSLRSTCGFCGHDVYLACDDAEKAERCRRRRGALSDGHPPVHLRSDGKGSGRQRRA